MNKWIGTGRLCGEPEVRYSQGENAMAIARYRLAVDRRFKKDNEQTADFISCVAFGKAAEFAEKYLHKGMKIAVTGRIQTGSYEKDGQKVYTTEIVVEDQEFCESKGSSESQAAQASDDGFMNIPDNVADELPFD
jgi:single-strand DNA-binding protein